MTLKFRGRATVTLIARRDSAEIRTHFRIESLFAEKARSSFRRLSSETMKSELYSLYYFDEIAFNEERKLDRDNGLHPTTVN